MMRALLFGVAACSVVTPATASDLYRSGNWSALASDRRAAQAGDSVTILVVENSSATNSATSGSRKSNRLDGRIFGGGSLDESAGLSFGGASDNMGSTARSGRMAAQISALVEEVLANGDLRVAGSQMMMINGERTVIRVRGHIRPADISPANVVLSSRMTDAQIDYDGSGFVSRSGKPGLVTRIFNWLGLL